MIVANFHYKQNIKYTYFSGSSRSYIDHICVSENAIKKVTECTILPHHVDNVGDHLPVKVKIKLQCMPSSNEHNNDFSDDVMCKNINNIDWSRETIRKQHLVNLKNYTTDINNLNHISTITDDKAAQLCVNELNDGIIKSIHKACANITDEANTKNSINPLKSRHTPWWTSSTQVAKNRKSLWYDIWSSCDKPRDGYIYIYIYIYAINLPKPSIGKLVVLHLMNV